MAHSILEMVVNLSNLQTSLCYVFEAWIYYLTFGTIDDLDLLVLYVYLIIPSP